VSSILRVINGSVLTQKGYSNDDADNQDSGYSKASLGAKGIACDYAGTRFHQIEKDAALDRLATDFKAKEIALRPIPGNMETTNAPDAAFP